LGSKELLSIVFLAHHLEDARRRPPYQETP